MVARPDAHRRAAAVIALALFGLSVCFVPSAAAVDPGNIDHVAFSATPRVQGIGGPVSLIAKVYVATDPHRNLFVYNLTLQIGYDAGLTLVEGENPVVRPVEEIPPSFGLYELSFSWLMTTTAVGVQNLTLTVSTTGGGGATANSSVTVREGVVFGITRLSPAQPTTASALTFSVPVASGFDDPLIPINVTLFVFETSASPSPVAANGSRLRLSTDEVVSGVRLRMDGNNGTYTYTIPAQPRGTLIYWVFVETPYNNVTSAPQRVFIEDPTVTGSVSGGALVAVVAVFLALGALVVIDPRAKQAPVGSIHNSPDRLRLSFVLVAIGAVLFVYAFVAGVPAVIWRRLFGY